MEWRAINTVTDAIEFLRTIEVEAIGIWEVWVLHGVGEFNNDFELTCDGSAELIEYARSERDMCLSLCRQLGVKSLKDIPKASATDDDSSPSEVAKGQFPLRETKSQEAER
jgi:hypothetical protein